MLAARLEHAGATGKRGDVGHIFESFVFAEVLKSYYNDGIVKPPLYYYRDTDKNEIDLLVEDGDLLHPVEIKTTSDPTKSMVKAFRCLDNIPRQKDRDGRGDLFCQRTASADRKCLDPAGSNDLAAIFANDRYL